MRRVQYAQDAPVSQRRLAEPQLALAFDAVLEHEAPPRVDAHPIIKWAGGKTQLLATLQQYLPPMEHVGRYFEPFVGGAAMFFHLQHHNSLLADTNPELVNLYLVVRDQLGELLRALKHHKQHHDEVYFYQVRAADPNMLTPVERAARVIYLNKTCYNGLYRVNSKGQFNVPSGKYKNPAIYDARNLESASLALQRAELIVGDFEAVLADAKREDFIYLDPPYHPLTSTSSFTSYTDRSFDANEQARLALTFRRLHREGCYLMQSNSDTALVHALYVGFRIVRVAANRAINSKGDKRGPVSELLIMNYSETGESLNGDPER